MIKKNAIFFLPLFLFLVALLFPVELFAAKYLYDKNGKGYIVDDPKKIPNEYICRTIILTKYPDEAIKFYNKIIISCEVSGEKPSHAYAKRAGTWNSKGDYDKAIEDYTKAIELDPTFAVAYYRRGGVWESKGDYDKAIADYEKAVELKPDDTDYQDQLNIARSKKAEQVTISKVETSEKHEQTKNVLTVTKTEKAIFEYNESTKEWDVIITDNNFSIPKSRIRKKMPAKMVPKLDLVKDE